MQEGSYAYEETRITKTPGKSEPTVHTTLSKLGNFDLQEHLTNKEIALRGKFRPIPNVIGFSLYYRKTQSGIGHLSIVENTLEKAAGYGWTE